MNYYNPMDQPCYQQEKNPPSMAYKQGEDVAQWKAKAKVKLTSLVGLDMFTKVTDDHFTIESKRQKEGYESIRFSLLVEENNTAVGYLLLPNNIPNPPLMICLQGHSNGMHISLGIAKIPEEVASIAGGRDFAIQAVAQGYAALVIEQRCFGERKRTPEDLGTDCYVPSMYELMLGRTMMACRVWDTSRTLDAILKEFNQLDDSTIGIMGNSGGGTATYYTTCLDDRITICMPSCAVCTFKESIATIQHCVCNHIPSILKYFEMADLALLIAPRPMVVVCGKEDGIFPLTGVKAAYVRIQELYVAAGAKDKCTLAIGPNGHQFYPKEGWSVLGKLV